MLMAVASRLDPRRSARERAALFLALAALAGLAGCGGGPASPDTGALDAPAGPDAFVGCTIDDDCEDGLACNGLARCEGGRCVASTPLDCDDGVACTTDFCSEELRRCVSRPPDGDGDGVAAASCLDARGMPLGDDCDDASARVYPGAVELCDADGLDEDCDPTTRGGRDGDGDGFEDVACCNGTGAGACGDDCNDAVRGANPGATESCNAIDDDCDGRIDEAVLVTVYRDADGDGRGDTSMPSMACATTAGYAAEGGDCDDADAARSPALPEICDGIDDDCNGVADFAVGPGDTEDDDLDGYPDASCAASPTGADCDDRDASSRGGATESCDGRDNDCDGRTDEGVTSTSVYRDEDGDGWGSARGGVAVGCGAVEGYSAGDGDCDDGSSLRHPGGLEGCNGVDDDCDGAVDEDPGATLCAPVGGVRYACRAARCRPIPECPVGLADCDGLASNGCETDLTSSASSCGVCGRRCASEPGAPGQCVASRCSPIACAPGFLDCDGDLGRGGSGCEQPASCGACGAGGASETCGNGVDDNCDGRIDEGCCTAGVACTTACGSHGSLACDAGGASRCVAPAETCNGMDDDCDGLGDEGCCVAGTACHTSCDPVGVETGTRACLPMAVPGACMPPAETCNGRDDDCDGLRDDDLGAPLTCGVGACVRTAARCTAGMPGTCTPGAPGTETCNAIDDDCDGTIDEGFGAPVVCGVGACQRTVPGCMGMMMMCTPGAPSAESCNGIDDDCNGAIDDGLGSSSCGTGACARTVPNCVMGVPQTCTAGAPGLETCNAVDDDCNMLVDDGLGSSICGVGACFRTVANCVGGMVQSCVPGAPGTESCNGIDDDCDMTVDDGLAPATCGIGACFRSIASCVGGMTQTCIAGTPSAEMCNGVDDDCNGPPDNGCPSAVGRGAATTGTLFYMSPENGVIDCPAGTAMVGFAGRSGLLVDQVEPYCAPLILDVNTTTSPDYTFTVHTGMASSAGTLGPAGGGPFGADLCPANQIAIGIRGGAGDSVDWVQVQCGTVTLTRSGGWVVTATPTVSTSDHGNVGGGAPYSQDCPAGQVMVGFAARVGGVLDGIGYRCAPITITTL